MGSRFNLRLLSNAMGSSLQMLLGQVMGSGTHLSKDLAIQGSQMLHEHGEPVLGGKTMLFHLHPQPYSELSQVSSMVASPYMFTSLLW